MPKFHVNVGGEDKTIDFEIDGSTDTLIVTSESPKSHTTIANGTSGTNEDDDWEDPETSDHTPITSVDDVKKARARYSGSKKKLKPNRLRPQKTKISKPALRSMVDRIPLDAYLVRCVHCQLYHIVVETPTGKTLTLPHAFDGDDEAWSKKRGFKCIKCKE